MAGQARSRRGESVLKCLVWAALTLAAVACLVAIIGTSLFWSQGPVLSIFSVAWGLIALEGVALITCGFLQWHADRSAKSSLVGVFSLLAALCLVLTVLAAAVREVPALTGSIAAQLPEMFTEIAPQVLPRVLPAMLPGLFGQLLPQLMLVLNGTLPQLLPEILPKILPAILPEVIDSSPQIVTKILEDLPNILANVSSSAVNQTAATAAGQSGSNSPAAAANLPPIGNVIAGIVGALPTGRRLQQATQPHLIEALDSVSVPPLADAPDSISLPPLSLTPADLHLPPMPELPSLPQPGSALPNISATLPHPDLPQLPPLSDLMDQLLGLLPTSGRRLLQTDDPQLPARGLLRAIGNGRSTVMMVGFALLAVADFALLILLGIKLDQEMEVRNIIWSQEGCNDAPKHISLELSRPSSADSVAPI